MKRKAIDELIKWKESNNRKPIILTGAKGVGKTYLAYDFAKAFFEHIHYIHLNREPKLAKLFIKGDSETTSQLLKQHFHIENEDNIASRILILDEISYSMELLSMLQEFYCYDLYDYIICIASNPIPREYIENTTELTLHPLEFDEFLRATGNEWYIDLIYTHYNNNTKLPDIVHKELLDLYQLYLRIGGMPGSINEYLNLSSVVNVSEQHNFLIGSYHDCINKENTESDALKMNQVFDSLTHQLMKDNKKFQYKLIRKGTTHSMYKDAIQKLIDINYVIQSCRIDNEQFTSLDHVFELKEVFLDHSNFKLYLFDTGLLYTRIVEEYNNSLDTQSFKALIENYVTQSLTAKHYPFAFWESDSMAKIDFILYKNKEIIPIEIYADSKTRSKSINVFSQKCSFPYAIKISSKNFELVNNIKYVPYYAVFCI